MPDVPLVEIPAAAAVTLNVGVWFLWSVAVGMVGHRLPQRWLRRDRGPLRLARWEIGGRVYERRFAIKRWKDRLPEAGAFFAGGISKRSLDGIDLAQFAVETRRAEWVHWGAMLVWPTFGIWNPPWAVGVMFGYAVGANAPCLLVQRYNRARLERIMRRRDRRRSGTIS